MSTEETPTAAVGSPGPVGGHILPATFSSSLPSAQDRESAHTQGTAAMAGGAGSVPHRVESRQVSGGRTVAILLSAALVGGLAGFGGSALADALRGPVGTAVVSGPSTITVNNPGSVNETTAVAAQVLPSTVTIQVSAPNGSGSGSGVILSEDGYVLTNAHVATLGGATAGAQILVTTPDGRIHDATIVGTDPLYDLAVLKLDEVTGLQPITFGDSSMLNVGDTTIAVGAPMGLANSVTTGIVSALDRSIRIASSAVPEEADSPTPDQGESPFWFDLPGQSTPGSTSATISIAVIQTDAAINPGNSGGALVNSRGELVGINVAIATAGASMGTAGSIGLGFAIPSNIAERIAQEIIENGSATHGLLGVNVQDARSVPDAQVMGAVVSELSPGGAAEQAGLRLGDIIVEFNDAAITGPVDLTAQVRALGAGEVTTLTFVRDGVISQLIVTLGTLGS